jgi:Domain of unknown function (DUF4124)
MLKWLIAVTSLLSAAAVAAPVWTWVDEQGTRHYSDRPVEGATQIEVAAPQTFEGAAPTQPPAQSTTSSDTAAAAAYSVLDIVRPQRGETLANTGTELTVELATYPALQPAHRIVLDLDGERLPISSRDLSITLSDVFRGEHTLSAAIVGIDGTELARSSPVTFIMRQRSGQQPVPQTTGPARPLVTRPPTAPPQPRPQPRANPN